MPFPSPGQQLALEVPLAQFDPADAPLREVPGGGEALFRFAALPPGASRAGKSDATQGSTACSRALVWQLDGGAPDRLLLTEAAVNEERRDGALRLAFSAPLLPSVSCVDAPQGGTQAKRVAVVTADGYLHTLLYASAAGGIGQAAAAAPPGLARQLANPAAITSVPLAAHFQRAGAPSAVLEVGGWVCVGTEEGNVVCLPAGASDPAAAVVLTASSGLTKMLGGLFGKAAGQAVRQLAELRYMEQRLLCAVHESGQLRLWDLGTRRLVHTADLLPFDKRGAWVPKLARLTPEPLDAATSILLVYFEPAQAAAAASDGADPATAGAAGQEAAGFITACELYLEHRGEGLFKVLVESSRTLQAEGIHRVCDMALENIALHTVGAWLLCTDAAGRRSVLCAPVSFSPDGAVQLSAEVHLVEKQLLEGTAAPLAVEAEVWRAVESQLGSSGGAAPAPAAVGEAFADAVLAPGRLSRRALHAALAGVGSAVPREAVLSADLEELRQQLPRWVAAIPSAAVAAAGCGASGGGGAGSTSPSAGVLARWRALLAAYSRAWDEAHAPLALLQLPPQADAQYLLLLARRGGMVTALRPAAAPELTLRSAMPADWLQAGGEEAATAPVALEAAAAVAQAAGGGQLARLVWACLQEGQDLSSTVLPAIVRSLAAGASTPPPAAGPAGGARISFPGAPGLGGAAGGAGGAAGAYAEWRATCRRLPLQLARLCGGCNFPAAALSAVQILGAYVDASRVRSALPALSKPVRSAVLASLSQIAWAQLQQLLQLALLLQYTLWCQHMGSWSLTPEDSRRLESEVLPPALELLQAAAAAYWCSVTPAAPEAGAGEGWLAGLDPSQLVRALRIGEGGPGGGGGAATGTAAKRARLSSQPQDGYVAGPLLAAFAATKRVHVVRDLPDLQRVCLLFSQRLLCLAPSRLHPSRRLQPPAPEDQLPPSPADLAVEICSLLFQGRHTGQLAALQRLLPAVGGGGDGGLEDVRLLFFRACSKARQIAQAPSPAEQQRLEEQSCSLFFRVASVFTQAAADWAGPGCSGDSPAEQQAKAVSTCVRQLLADVGQDAEPVAAGPPAAELQYLEALMVLYERMGRYQAATRFALAAARQVAAALPDQSQLPSRAQAQGRLWANVFSCMMEAGRYEEAYVAMLSNEVPEVQLDCLHRLLAGLCASEGGVELLCRLPFAQNMLVWRGGRQVWVPLLEEAVATLGRRASQLDLRASPQPYKVLADFHICRSNYQAAAGAMHAYARRLVAECAEEPPQLAEAQRALATAVSCLSLVEKQHAWVEGPATPDGSPPPPAAAAAANGGMAETDGEDGSETRVLTLADLRREYAVTRGQVALAAAMPGADQGHATLAGGRGGGEAGRGGDAEGVFSQLLALGLHDDAFQLAEAAFVDSQLTRALERAFASLAAACVRQQLALGKATAGGGASSAAAMLARAGSEDMDEGEGAEGAGAAAAAAAAVEGFGAASARADGGAVADWRRLKSWLARHEGGSHRFTLRLVILDAILRAEPAFMLPPWLMSALRPPTTAPSAAPPASPSTADLGGALRVLMRHARLADAASLAAAHLQAALQTVPSVGMARTSQVYFPQALLDELLARLGAQAGMAAEKQRVGELLARVRGAAARQTDVIQQLFAH